MTESGVTFSSGAAPQVQGKHSWAVEQNLESEELCGSRWGGKAAHAERVQSARGGVGRCVERARGLGPDCLDLTLLGLSLMYCAWALPL